MPMRSLLNNPYQLKGLRRPLLPITQFDSCQSQQGLPWSPHLNPNNKLRARSWSGPRRPDLSNNNPQKTNNMKTTANPRPSRSASRGRPTPKPTAKSNTSSLRKGSVSTKKPIRKPAAAASTASTKIKRRFQPPPPPPMYWICYDFSVKLCRGVCLGIGIGLLLTVVLPWAIDSGYEVYDTIAEANYQWPDMSVYYSNLTTSWNVTSSRIWRPDQHSQARTDSSSSGGLRGSPQEQEQQQVTTDPKVQDLVKLSESFPSGPRVERTITVVHVGFTGGQALLQMNSNLACQERHARDPTQFNACLQQSNLRTNQNSSSPLAKQAKYYLHMGTKPSEQLQQQSTSVLFTLRNPIDRILDVYADSHPLACSSSSSSATADDHHRPWGCTTKELWDMPETDPYNFYAYCFPDLNPEAFAQAVKSPWVNGTVQMIASIGQQRTDCRWLAKQVVSGNSQFLALAPHMRYNYQYYWQQAMNFVGGKDKEVLALRAEQEDEDLALLHRLMGGDPRVELPTVPPKPSTATVVSEQAYQKLCCILQDEIQAYETILKQAANLPQYSKQEAMEDLKQKCGLATTGWDEWRIQCKMELESDSFLLTP